jgi:translation initiation factor IF-3
MGSGPRRPYPSHHVPQVRKNERIRAPEVRVIGHDGKQIGILPTREAMRIAQTQGFDLVEVSPGAQPPVCKILDYGKYMYEEGKKQKHHKAHASKLKEVKFRPRIEQHDYITKLRHVEEFLFHSDKVKLTLFFKGREMEHKELGFETMKRAIADLAHCGTPDQPPRLFGRNITTTLSPLPPNKRKWKYNLREDGSPPRSQDLSHSHDHGHDDHDAHGHEAHAHGHDTSPPPAGAVTSLGAALNSAQAAAKPPVPST